MTLVKIGSFSIVKEREKIATVISSVLALAKSSFEQCLPG